MISVVITPFGDYFALDKLQDVRMSYGYVSTESIDYIDSLRYRSAPPIDQSSLTFTGYSILAFVGNDIWNTQQFKLTNEWATSGEAWEELRELYPNDFKIIIPTKYLD